MKALGALRKIAREQKIDVLTKLISEHWGSEGDDDNPSAAESNGLVLIFTNLGKKWQGRGFLSGTFLL